MKPRQLQPIARNRRGGSRVPPPRNSRTETAGNRAPLTSVAREPNDGPSEPRSYYPAAFTFHAPDADSVCVAGTFNDWDAHCTPLERGIHGEWSGYLPLKPGRYEYRFVVDGVWCDDPAATASAPNPFGSTNAVLVVQEEPVL